MANGHRIAGCCRQMRLVTERSRPLKLADMLRKLKWPSVKLKTRNGGGMRHISGEPCRNVLHAHPRSHCISLSMQVLFSQNDYAWFESCREQERIQKAEQARQETERILRDQQAEVDKKKADMIRRDVAREEVKSRKQLEAAAKNAEAQSKADARIAAALDAGRQMLQKRREEFDSKQRLNEERRR